MQFPISNIPLPNIPISVELRNLPNGCRILYMLHVQSTHCLATQDYSSTRHRYCRITLWPLHCTAAMFPLKFQEFCRPKMRCTSKGVKHPWGLQTKNSVEIKHSSLFAYHIWFWLVYMYDMTPSNSIYTVEVVRLLIVTWYLPGRNHFHYSEYYLNPERGLNF